MRRVRSLAIVFVAALAGCADTTVLVPANSQAQFVGTPKLHYLSGVPGGPMYITMPDGETLSGDFAVEEGAAAPVAVQGGTAQYFGLAGGNFRVTAHGPRTAMACRALLIGGHGAGVCRDQNGAEYTIAL